jgi:leucyl-tRNA synthetase
MELLNSLAKFTDDSETGKAIRQEVLEAIVLMLSPMVPHICHQLWLDLGHQDALLTMAWPVVDESALVQDLLELVVQVNGKLRSKISVAAAASKDDIQTIALADEQVLRFIDGNAIKKVIIVPGKLVNIVI